VPVCSPAVCEDIMNFLIATASPRESMRNLLSRKADLLANYRERRQCVMDAISQLGPRNQVEEPLPPDPVLAAAAAQAWSERIGVLHVPDTAEGCWLAALARPLFGPRGPKVLVG
jgi:hypothetical protein